MDRDQSHILYLSLLKAWVLFIPMMIILLGFLSFDHTIVKDCAMLFLEPSVNKLVLHLSS